MGFIPGNKNTHGTVFISSVVIHEPEVFLILWPILSSDYEEITIDPVCGWKPVPVKPDLHIKEEPDGPVLKRCRTVSPSHMVLPNVMEMIASLGPESSPYQSLTTGGRTSPDYNRPGDT